MLKKRRVFQLKFRVTTVVILFILGFGFLGFNHDFFVFAGRYDQKNDEYGQKIEAEEQDTQGKAEAVEPTEAEELEETPEPKEVEQEHENEKEVEQVREKIERQTRYGQVENVEVSGDGKVKIQKKNQQVQTETVKPTKVDILKLQDQENQVSVNVNRMGQVTMSGGGVVVTSNYPIVIDPNNSSIAVKTPAGTATVVINPASVVEAIPIRVKPTRVESVSLDMVDKAFVYNVYGQQVRKLLGLIPVSVDIQTLVNAQDGNVLRVKQPWYFRLIAPISVI